MRFLLTHLFTDIALFASVITNYGLHFFFLAYNKNIQS